MFVRAGGCGRRAGKAVSTLALDPTPPCSPDVERVLLARRARAVGARRAVLAEGLRASKGEAEG
jgi:hypothetical protein